MSTYYEAYGQCARECSDPLIVVGRNRFQQKELDAAVEDVARKLEPGPNDRFLDVGCNIGVFLSRLAGDFRERVGQDHDDLLRVFRQRGVPENVSLMPGFWPEVQPEGGFDCILVYSVMSYLPNVQVANEFVRACLRKLNPGGRLLFGDIPNRDRRERYLVSAHGREIAKAYDEVRARDRANDPTGEYVRRDKIMSEVVKRSEFIDDTFVLNILAEARRDGCDSYLLPQPEGLPYCHAHEDVLIVRRR